MGPPPKWILTPLKPLLGGVCINPTLLQPVLIVPPKWGLLASMKIDILFRGSKFQDLHLTHLLLFVMVFFLRYFNKIFM